MAADENKKRWLKLVSPGRIEKFMRLAATPIDEVYFLPSHLCYLLRPSVDLMFECVEQKFNISA